MKNSAFEFRRTELIPKELVGKHLDHSAIRLLVKTIEPGLSVQSDFQMHLLTDFVARVFATVTGQLQRERTEPIEP